ncbi:hypothetical protein RchiOBHm_Chr6g0257221 [Rosa chinensis]|uniref:Uncharacterized protein n=1 Tax=Rosa chinensis TaxID=74649 RepID=A0A2P6PMB6_ROSCH|nr:hypothetical protein RchiOBHm_Chr6g0257221 [Rosa chinensis]
MSHADLAPTCGLTFQILTLNLDEMSKLPLKPSLFQDLSLSLSLSMWFQMEAEILAQLLLLNPISENSPH